MLLSRVANNLYWLGRYIERSENAARQIQVASDFSVEIAGLDMERAKEEWELLSLCFPVADGHTIKGARKYSIRAVRYINHFLVNPENQVSVYASLTKAKENARAVSETLTREVIYNLNESQRRLKRYTARGFKDESKAVEFVALTERSILTTLGAIEHTLTRDQGWAYHKFGEAMERTQRTLFVLGARLPQAQAGHETAPGPLDFANWRSLLSHLASLENYRQKFGPRFNGQNVREFLVFNDEAPRSVSCGVRRMLGYLKQMPIQGPGIESALRDIGKLNATLQYDQREIMEMDDLTPFVNDTLTILTRVHMSMTSPDEAR